MNIADMPESCSEDIRLSVPKKFRRGTLGHDEKLSIGSAIKNLKRIASLTELPDWSRLNILDYGCGVKFTQTLIQYGIDVGSYTGIDVYKEMIAFLQDQVHQPNFHYYEVPFRNERYNPQGVEMTPDCHLPGEIEHYNLITLQSVFTHLNPDDFQSLLHILRRYIDRDGCMLFTCLIDEDMQDDFTDKAPDTPMLWAYYKEHYVRDMVKKGGWQLMSAHPPHSKMQTQIVCRPSLQYKEPPAPGSV